MVGGSLLARFIYVFAKACECYCTPFLIKPDNDNNNSNKFYNCQPQGQFTMYKKAILKKKSPLAIDRLYATCATGNKDLVNFIAIYLTPHNRVRINFYKEFCKNGAADESYFSNNKPFLPFLRSKIDIRTILTSLISLLKPFKS